MAVSRCSPRWLIDASLRLNTFYEAVPLLIVRPSAAAMPLPMFCDVVITARFCWLAYWRSCCCRWLIVYFYLVTISPVDS